MLTSDEAFVALRGAARGTLAGDEHELRAGDCLVVSPDRQLAIRNDGPEAFEAGRCRARGGKAAPAGQGALAPPRAGEGPGGAGGDPGGARGQGTFAPPWAV